MLNTLSFKVIYNGEFLLQYQHYIVGDKIKEGTVSFHELDMYVTLTQHV